MAEQSGLACTPGPDIMPGKHYSYWIGSAPGRKFPDLPGAKRADAVVVGAGITGITTAALLAEEGMWVVVLEAGRIAQGVTGQTTAKVSVGHHLIYNQLAKKKGEEAAHIYAQANQAALEKMAELVLSRNLECDFTRTDAYLYTESERMTEEVAREAETAQRAGLAAEFTEKTPLPDGFGVRGALRYRDQAQFHPRRYLIELLASLLPERCEAYESTIALDVEDGRPCRVVTNRGDVTADHVVIATHFPFHDPNLYFARLYPQRSYALAVHLNSRPLEGLYFQVDGTEGYGLRNQPADDGRLLYIISGADHKTGQENDTVGRFKRLLDHTRQRLDVESVEHYWSTQDLYSMDRVPYIGKVAPGYDNVYVATGFGGWGMTNSMVAATLISDMILGNENRAAELFNPYTWRGITREAAKQNLNVAKEYAKGLIAGREKKDWRDMKPGEAGVLVVNGDRTAVYRDMAGEYHSVSPHCTHKGCPLNWNAAEESWDCPCHGARFNSDGLVLHGPALKPLEPKPLT
ncbi:MAG: FAD-dependent oxidoreductase [Candidatus Geothermincolia bacterium]